MGATSSFSARSSISSASRTRGGGDGLYAAAGQQAESLHRRRIWTRIRSVIGDTSDEAAVRQAIADARPKSFFTWQRRHSLTSLIGIPGERSKSTWAAPRACWTPYWA